MRLNTTSKLLGLGAGTLLMAGLVLPLHAENEAESTPENTRVIRRVVVTDAAGENAKLDIEALREKLRTAIGDERSDEILQAVEPLLQKLQNAEYNDLTPENIEMMMDSDGAADVRVFRSDVNVEMDTEANGDGQPTTKAKVVIKKMTPDGKVEEQVMEGDDAIQFIEAGEGMPKCSAAAGKNCGVTVKVMRFNDGEGEGSSLLKFETSGGAHGMPAEVQEMMKNIEMNIEMDGEGESGNHKVVIMRKHIGQDVEQMIEEDGNIMVVQQGEPGEAIEMDNVVIRLGENGEGDDKMTWFTEDGDMYGLNRRVIVYVDAEKFTTDGESSPNTDRIATALIDAEVIVLSDEPAEISSDGMNADAQDKRAADVAALPLTGFNVYPNPNDGLFNLEFNLPQAGPTTVKIVDLQGREVFREEFTSAANQPFVRQIDLTNDTGGVYMLSVTQNGATATKKIEVR